MRCKCCGHKLPENKIHAMGIWTNIESRILLALDGGKKHTTDELTAKVWPGDKSDRRDIHNRLTVHVYRIRDKLEVNGIPWELVNRWGKGYALRGVEA